MKPMLLIAVACIALLGCVVSETKQKPPLPYPIAEQKFDSWMKEHSKHCKDCGKGGPSNPICTKAFQQLQQMFVDAEKDGWKFSPKDGWHRAK